MNEKGIPKRDTGVSPVSSGKEHIPVTPFRAFDERSEVEIARRNLPHWNQAGCTYFVTFRLADSLPQSQLRAWREERDAWCALHPKPWDDSTLAVYEARFTEQMQKWLDAGYGSCALARAPVREIVFGAMDYFNKQRYNLGDGVLMPNHVHVLVAPLEGHDLSSILHSWKSYTSKEINRLLGTKGTFWMDENHDHIVRSAEQLRYYQHYIAQNPIKAGLSTGSFLWWERPLE